MNTRAKTGPVGVEKERSRILWVQKRKGVKGFCFVSVAMKKNEYFQIVNYFCSIVLVFPLPFLQTGGIPSSGFCSSVTVDRENKERESHIFRN